MRTHSITRTVFYILRKRGGKLTAKSKLGMTTRNDHFHQKWDRRNDHFTQKCSHSNTIQKYLEKFRITKLSIDTHDDLPNSIQYDLTFKIRPRFAH